GNRPIPGQPGGTMDLSVPGYLAMIVGSTGLMGVPGWIAGYREQGIFRRLRLTPVRPWALLLAQATVGLLAGLTGTLFLFIAGRLVFHVRIPAAPLQLLLAFVLGYAAMFSLGAMLATVVRNARGAQAAGMAIYFPMLFLSGAAF